MHDATFSRRAFLAATGLAGVSAWAGAQPGNAAGTGVRVGFIGVGSRGTGLLKVLLSRPDTEVPAICDIAPAHLERAQQIVEQVRGARPEGYSRDEYDYRRVLERDDLDAVLVATPAEWHARMAVDALRAGKHAATEVPGAHTLEECWDLVKAKEESGKRYMLLENYVYFRNNMMVMNMAGAGAFGSLYYGECGYIHDCRSLRFEGDGTLTWRGEAKRDMFGNLYPTHSLGPVSKWMGIHQGDRLTSLTSRMSEPRALQEYAAARFGEDSPAARTRFKAGDMSVTLLHTAKGRLITVYFDSDSPRPNSNFYLLQGTKGVFDSRFGIYIDEVSAREQWEPADRFRQEHEHAYWRDRSEEAGRTGHGGGDYFVLSDFVDMVRTDSEPLVDVYDSAAWSSLIPLSAESIEQDGAPVEIPDFTKGAWEHA